MFEFQATFKPTQRVKIIALERPAVVRLVRIDQVGHVDYFLTWWDEGERRSEWVDGDEIETTNGYPPLQE